MNAFNKLVRKLKDLHFLADNDNPLVVYFRTSNGKGISIYDDGRIFHGGKFISEEVLMLKIRRKEFIPYSDKIYDCYVSGNSNSTLFAECCGSANSKGAIECFGCGSKIRTE